MKSNASSLIKCVNVSPSLPRCCISAMSSIAPQLSLSFQEQDWMEELSIPCCPDISPTITHLPLATLILINLAGWLENIYLTHVSRNSDKLEAVAVCKIEVLQRSAQVGNRQLIMASSASSGAWCLNKELGPSWSMVIVLE